jgi:NAD(P)-dependent dehydrogenase (short-subunit alcohol dehydrogenase family)
LDWKTTSLEDWNRHLMVNLTTPFLLIQAFARQVSADHQGRIVNLLDWRALRPGADHLPYTISKVALAGLTRSLAQAFAPQIQVNGVALGAILPPADGADTSAIIRDVPARRWADLAEVGQAVIFLLSGPTYITGEILHVDGGRHLV